MLSDLGKVSTAHNIAPYLFTVVHSGSKTRANGVYAAKTGEGSSGTMPRMAWPVKFRKAGNMHHSGDNFIPIVPADTKLHTPESPFCGIDPGCPCYEDPDNREALAQAIQDGELTPDEASNIIRGRTI